MSLETATFEIGKNRIEALSDGIFAIVMTLLILELHVPNLPPTAPNVEVTPALIALWPKFVSYLVAFVSLGVFWVGHHMMYHAIRRADRTLLWLNIVFFMFVSLLPFSTSVLNAFPRALIAPFLFGANLALVGWLLFLQWAYVGSQPGMLAPFVTTKYRATVKSRMLAVPIATTLTAFVCFWSAGISVAIYLLLLPLYTLPIRKSAMQAVSNLIALAALTFGVALLDSAAFAQPQPAQPLQKIEIIRLDPKFDKLVPMNVRVERIVSGRQWVEGPVWNRREGYLLFSDIPANSVIKWQKGIGASVYLKPSGYTGNPPFGGPEPGSNGLAFDPQGRLVLAAHGDRRIARLERNGKQTTLIDRFEGKRINSPNDLVFNSNGDLYFTDPPFGLPKSYDDPRKELPYQGVYRLTRSGKLSLLTKDIKAPNGIAFSPDEKKLYISNADPANAVWMVYEVKPDGTIENGKVLFNATGWTKDKTGAPDGMKVDRDGNIFGAGPGGVYVIAPDGTHLGTIDLDAPTGNVAFGEDGSSLFITSNQNVYRLKLTTRGASY